MKKLSFLLTIFLLLTFTGCDSPSLSGKKVKKEYFTGGQIRTELIMDDNSGQNGLRKTYGYNGHVTSTVTIRNGVKDGIEIWFDSHDRPIRRVPYVNGRIHGTVVELYENGDKMVTIPFIEGIKHGMAHSYNKNGSVNRRVMYRNGKISN